MIGLVDVNLALWLPTCMSREMAVTTTCQFVSESGSLKRTVARPFSSVRTAAFQ